MKIFINVWVLLFWVCIALQAQIGAKASQSAIVQGLWQNSQFGYQMTLLLNPDGTGEFDGELISYKAQGTILSITLNGTTTAYQFTLLESTLTLSGGDLEGNVAFTRSSTLQSQQTGKKGAAFSNTAGEVLGVWSGSGEMIEFRADGVCAYLGNTFPYQISQGYIVLTTQQGPVSFKYVVRGDALTLTANGQQVVYNKAKGTEPLKAQVNEKGKVALELVGQWCYLNMSSNSQTSRCITLNADGTYYFSAESSRSVNTETINGGTATQDSDRGTWFVQGDRIYYQSQSRGAGSYRLEKRNHPRNVNDPMIVLDGEPYVTATQRAPWR